MHLFNICSGHINCHIMHASEVQPVDITARMHSCQSAVNKVEQVTAALKQFVYSNRLTKPGRTSCQETMHAVVVTLIINAPEDLHAQRHDPSSCTSPSCTCRLPCAELHAPCHRMMWLKCMLSELFLLQVWLCMLRMLGCKPVPLEELLPLMTSMTQRTTPWYPSPPLHLTLLMPPVSPMTTCLCLTLCS